MFIEVGVDVFFFVCVHEDVRLLKLEWMFSFFVCVHEGVCLLK